MFIAPVIQPLYEIVSAQNTEDKEPVRIAKNNDTDSCFRFWNELEKRCDASSKILRTTIKNTEK